MNLLIRNIEIYRQVKLLRLAIGALIKGNVKPLIGYFRYLNLKIENKEKLYEFSRRFEDLKYVLYYYFDNRGQILSLLALEKSIVIEFPGKCKFFTNRLEDYVHSGLYNEPKTFHFIKEKIKKARVFVDVGANIGGYSIRATKYCKLYAIEPLPRNYEILKINEKLNSVKINSFNLVVGKERRKVKLYYEPRIMQYLL